MSKYLSRIIVSLVLFIVLAAPNQPIPVTQPNPSDTPAAPAPAPAPSTPSTSEGIPVGDTGLPGNLPRLGLDDITDPVSAAESFMLNYIIRPIFFLSGGVAIIMIMYSSFQIITARGEEEGITGAKTTLLWSFVGLGLVVLAYTIVSNLAVIILRLI